MSLEIQDQNEREVVRSLLKELKPFFKLRPSVLYFDLIATGLVAWASLLLIQFDFVVLPLKVVLAIFSYLAFYRGLLFIHEVVHFHKKIAGSRLLYNLFFGFPCRVPFFTHDPHRFHHLPNTFGTADDPEYAYLKGSGIKTLIKPFFVGALSPLILIGRFGIVPLVSWAFPKRWRQLLFERASTIVVNPDYRRVATSSEELKSIKVEELMCAGFFVLQIILFQQGLIKPSLFVIWLTLLSIGTFVNVWRARISHRYDNNGEMLSPLAQLRDSVTVEQKFLSSIWAPAGMMYHSLHHLAPQIPYYNLEAAHHHLAARLDHDHPYLQTVVKNGPQGLKIFYNTVLAKH